MIDVVQKEGFFLFQVTEVEDLTVYLREVGEVRLERLPIAMVVIP